MIEVGRKAIEVDGKLDHYRAADIFPVVGQPGIWRINIRIYPEISGWLGGRILWGYDRKTRRGAVALAMKWVETGTHPPVDGWPRI